MVPSDVSEKVNETKPPVSSKAPDKSVWPSPVETTPKVTVPSGLPTMTYTANGFSPMVLEIKRGAICSLC